MKYNKRVEDRFNHKCVICGEIKKHHSKGMCKSCYNRELKNLTTENKEDYNKYHRDYAHKEMNKNVVRMKTYKNKDKILKIRLKKCELCDSKENLEIHHIKYTDNPEDLLVLYRKCHKLIHTKKFNKIFKYR